MFLLGKLVIEEMWSANGTKINQVVFNKLDIRNEGTVVANNGREVRILEGHSVRVYPGALLLSNNLLLKVHTCTVDVLGEIKADSRGYEPMGKCHNLFVSVRQHLQGNIFIWGGGGTFSLHLFMQKEQNNYEASMCEKLDACFTLVI